MITCTGYRLHLPVKEELVNVPIANRAYIHINEYETDKQSGLYELKDKPFSKEEIAFSKGTLQLMLKENTIIDVERE